MYHFFRGGVFMKISKKFFTVVLVLAVLFTCMTPVMAATKTPVSTMALTGFSFPNTLDFGKSFSLKGTIKSNYKITSVTVNIINTTNNTVECGKSLANTTKSFAMSKIDLYITFGKLTAGSKRIEIWAKDEYGVKRLYNTPFTLFRPFNINDLNRNNITTAVLPNGWSKYYTSVSIKTSPVFPPLAYRAAFLDLSSNPFGYAIKIETIYGWNIRDNFGKLYYSWYKDGKAGPFIETSRNTTYEPYQI